MRRYALHQSGDSGIAGSRCAVVEVDPRGCRLRIPRASSRPFALRDGDGRLQVTYQTPVLPVFVRL